MSKKVIFFLYSLSGGGAERTVINIMNNLGKEYKIKLVLGTYQDSDYMNLIEKDIDIKLLNCSKLRFCLFKLIKCIRYEKPDLLFSTINSNNLVLLLAKVLSFTKTPVVVREANNRTQSGAVSFINKIVTRIFYNYFSEKVISLSEGVRNDLVDNFHIKNSKITVIFNPVEGEKIKELSQEKIIGLNKKTDSEKIILSVGRLVRQKDFKTLIYAFNLVAEDIDSRLILLGKGPLERELKQDALNLGIENQIEFLGFKDNPYKYMKYADVFVLSSQWEGFGHVIVEAMATGTPVISTDCRSGPKEIIRENEYGLLTPVGNYKELAKNIINLLSNDQLLKKYSIAGKYRAENFDATKITNEYEQIFTEIIDKS